jgi:hypothetical protein
MFEVVVERLAYVKDVPSELLWEALAGGVLRKGSVVGIEVSGPGGETALVEVRLSEDAQSELLKAGLKVPLEEGSGVLSFSPDWQLYLPKEVDSAEASEDMDYGGTRRRPTPGAL